MHPAGNSLSGTLLNAVHYYFDQQGVDVRAGFLNRLDKGTSGVVLMAKTQEAHQRMQKQISLHTMDKVYLALCQGVLKTPEGFVEAPLLETTHPFQVKMAVSDAPGGKYALTRYQTLMHGIDFSLLGIRLHTGRQHQIRVHMAHIGHPLIGDMLYGSERNFTRPALHSYLASFRHPADNQRINLYAEMPEDFRAFTNDHPDFLFKIPELDLTNSEYPCNPHPWLENCPKLPALPKKFQNKA